jgi:hypothetical protein
MAARRERERRRPTERRYNFTTPEAELVEANGAETDVLDTADTEVEAGAPPSATAPVRGGARPVARPFSSYMDEYAYVYRDLRRVAAVIGGLLVALIVLYFALPLLVH